MVRVNLLPDKRQAARAKGAAEPTQFWLIAVMGAFVATIIVCLFIQKLKEDELAGILAENARTQGQIDAIKQQIADHPQIKERLKELREREEAIQKLQSGADRARRRRSSSSRTC